MTAPATIAALWLETLALLSAPADLPPPRIILDDANYYVRGEIHVRPDECFATAFLHEAAHHVAVESGMLIGVPNSRVKARLEEIAADVEKKYGDAVHYMPNCETHGG